MVSIPRISIGPAGCRINRTMRGEAGLPRRVIPVWGSGTRVWGSGTRYQRHISVALAFLASTVNEHPTWPRPGTSSHRLLYEFTTGLTGAPVG